MAPSPQPKRARNDQWISMTLASPTPVTRTPTTASPMATYLPLSANHVRPVLTAMPVPTPAASPRMPIQVPLRPKNTAQTIVVRMVLDQAGTYSVVVVNPGGEASNAVPLKVN